MESTTNVPNFQLCCQDHVFPFLSVSETSWQQKKCNTGMQDGKKRQVDAKVTGNRSFKVISTADAHHMCHEGRIRGIPYQGMHDGNFRSRLGSWGIGDGVGVLCSEMHSPPKREG